MSAAKKDRKVRDWVECAGGADMFAAVLLKIYWIGPANLCHVLCGFHYYPTKQENASVLIFRDHVLPSLSLIMLDRKTQMCLRCLIAQAKNNANVFVYLLLFPKKQIYSNFVIEAIGATWRTKIQRGHFPFTVLPRNKKEWARKEQNATKIWNIRGFIRLTLTATSCLIWAMLEQ